MGRFVPGILLGLFLALWTWAAVNPVSRFNWWIENLLVFLTVPALVVTYRWFKFSNAAYVAIALFLGLHVIGSHWSYALVPWPDWHAWGFARNEYDRLVHFTYGLLLTMPVADVFRRAGWGGPGRSYLLAVQFIVATGAVYEIIEWAAAMVINPAQADAFLGQQGDAFDAVADIALAGAGALVAAGSWWLMDATRRRSARSAATAK